ncbi:calcium/sodium antiporter [Thiospirochaeta perfilievii]|uniref:Calcium/sodium antiporter n=1 Tax=Thiospirochaeta perfilievii TaxID=252967 RepID=A0A5C1QBN8_9SPIO|nr:calcium/sodium antiporter [Thiospirochaeta perfilievii]QEN04480.1 calcium/sodium antiporter [Thiospirochaeta perfilievii]
MTDLLLQIGIFIIAVAVLVWASDKFIDAADSIGKFMKLPSFIIGVLLVGIGTSLPELVTSLVAVAESSSEIVVGNVFGSNIANMFLVFGAATLFSKSFEIKHDIMKTDLPFLMLATGYISIAVMDLRFSFGEGIICLIMLLLYLYRSLKDGAIETLIEEKAHKPTIKDWIFILLTPLLIFISSKFLITSIKEIAAIIGVGNEIVASTAVALGTSLPELMVTIQAGRKGQNEMAVGNVLGSNLFNILAVMGIPAMITTLIIPQSIIIFTLPMLIMSALLFMIIAQAKKVYRIYGFLFILMYIYYNLKQYDLI